MANDLETDVLLARLCTRVLKRRMEVYAQRTAPDKGLIEVKESGMVVCGYWVGKVFHMEVEKLKEK